MNCKGREPFLVSSPIILARKAVVLVQTLSIEVRLCGMAKKILFMEKLQDHGIPY